MRKIVLLLLLITASISQEVITVRKSNSTLTKGLVAFWNLDEVSGDRYDCWGGNTLADTNTVTYATGLIGGSAAFERDNSERLGVGDNPALSFGDEDFTVSAWVILRTQNNLSMGIAAKFHISSIIEYYLYHHSSNYFYFRASSDGTSTNAHSIQCVSPRPSVDTRYFVAGWHNAATDSIYVRANNGTVYGVGHTGGVFDGGNSFHIGKFTVNYFDGEIDLAAVHSRCPQRSNGFAMLDSLYNSGAGWRP